MYAVLLTRVWFVLCLDEPVILSYWEICFSGYCAWVFSSRPPPTHQPFQPSILPASHLSVHWCANTSEIHSFIHHLFIGSSTQSFIHFSLKRFLLLLHLLLHYFFIRNGRGIEPLHARMLDNQFSCNLPVYHLCKYYVVRAFDFLVISLACIHWCVYIFVEVFYLWSWPIAILVKLASM